MRKLGRKGKNWRKRLQEGNLLRQRQGDAAQVCDGY